MLPIFWKNYTFPCLPRRHDFVHGKAVRLVRSPRTVRPPKRYR